MSAKNTDHDWETFAQQEPYWAVLTQERFRGKVMDQAARAEFFLSGEKYIDWVFSAIRQHIDPNFTPVKGLDFGCGVGRLVLPIARRCQTAVGTDVAEGMLAEAQKNAQRENANNLSFVKGDDNCSNLPSGFDFVNSFIVFQHIPCERGITLFRRLVEVLNPGGVGAIHLTYSRSNFPVKVNLAHYNPDPPVIKVVPPNGSYHWNALKRKLRERVTDIFERRPAPVPQPEPEPEPAPPSGPEMQMNSYLLNPVFQILQEAGVREMYVAFSQHQISMGTVLFFKKGPALPVFPGLNE